MQSVNLTNHLLIAMPAMTDPYFSGTLIYVCEHNEQGALGVIVNRPLDMNLAALFERIDMPLERAVYNTTEMDRMPVYFGGPVQTDRGFVLHRPMGDWQSTMAVNANVALTSSRDILESVSKKGEPREIIVTLGYSGWLAGQLEAELVQNTWLTVPSQPHILFELPFEERLPAAMSALGVSFANLVEIAGHA